MLLKFKYFTVIATAIFLIGCGGGRDDVPSSNTGDDSGIDNSGNSNADTDNQEPDSQEPDSHTNTTGNPNSSGRQITITKDTQVESLGTKNRTQVSVSLGNSPKDLYILLSNSSQANAAVSIKHNAKRVTEPQLKSVPDDLQTDNTDNIVLKTKHAPAFIRDFNTHTVSLFTKKDKDSNLQSKIVTNPQSKNVAGDTHAFFLDRDTSSKTVATLKKVVSNVKTKFGSKTLYVWVSNDSFGSSCKKRNCVTQGMVNTLANKFLSSGSNNDIYDWVTNIYGEEWGATKYAEPIAANNEITVLLTDIPQEGVIGYFWSKDNLKQSTISGSNERIMFYADSVMFADPAGNGFWQREMYSTLAHEFTHMIEFYQKTVKKEASSDTWLAEMTAETTEYLVSNKVGHSTPRGITHTDGSAGSRGIRGGRFPAFNQALNTISLTRWNGTSSDYSKVSAFGTFLVNNYGGAKVLHNIMYDSSGNENALVHATGKPFTALLKEWGVGVLISDKVSPEGLPTYNRGDYLPVNYNGINYNLGSVNFFNYIPQPAISRASGAVMPQGNYYYKIGENVTGTVNIDLTLNGTTEATLIAK